MHTPPPLDGHVVEFCGPHAVRTAGTSSSMRATRCQSRGSRVCASRVKQQTKTGGPTSPSMWHYPLHFITQSNVQSHSVTGSCACRFSLVHSFARQRTCDGTQSSDADQKPTLAVFLGGAHRLTFTCLDQTTCHHQCKPVRQNCVTCVTYDSLFEWDAHRKRPLRRGKVAAIGSDGLSVGA